MTAQAMEEGILYEQLERQRVRCNVCLWRCIINPGKTGVCGVRLNQDGKIVPLNYARVSSLAADPMGMAGGQAIDLGSVGQSLTQTELEYMHIHKTGALIRAATLLGGHCSTKLDSARIHALDQYAQNIGLAFQVVDDILDTEADTATLGKTAGKDADGNKPTYVTILGLARAKELAQELYDQAIAPLQPYGEQASRLVQLAQFITNRGF